MLSSIIHFSLFLLLFPVTTGNRAEVKGDGFHPYYVSVTEVQHNAAEQSVEVSIKFFTDDFEKTLEKVNQAKLDIAAHKDKETLDKYIPAYINSHLQFIGDARKLNLDYVGYEIEKESVYCYFEIHNVPAIKKFEVNNSLLYDLTKEQLNIMHFTVKGKRVSKRLSFPATKAIFVF